MPPNNNGAPEWKWRTGMEMAGWISMFAMQGIWIMGKSGKTNYSSTTAAWVLLILPGNMGWPTRVIRPRPLFLIMIRMAIWIVSSLTTVPQLIPWITSTNGTRMQLAGNLPVIQVRAEIIYTATIMGILQ